MSVYYAFSGIDDAIEKTKNLLWPFNWSIWWRIALISLFTGGVGGINFPTSSFGDMGPSDLSNFNTGFISGIPDIIILLFVAILIIALIYTLISNIFQFVFVKCLSENRFSLKEYFMQNTGRGLRLFGFWILLILTVIAVSAVFILSIFSMGNNFNLPIFILTFILFLLLVIIVAVIAMFTVDFVIPIMLKDECGVCEGWKKCWRILRSNPGQSLVYLVMKAIISIFIAILLFVVLLILTLAIGIPFLILFLLAGIGSGFGMLHIALLVLFLIILIPIMLLISVPFNTFIRTYSLSVLGKMEPEYMLIE